MCHLQYLYASVSRLLHGMFVDSSTSGLCWKNYNIIGGILLIINDLINNSISHFIATQNYEEYVVKRGDCLLPVPLAILEVVSASGAGMPFSTIKKVYGPAVNMKDKDPIIYITV